MKKKEGFLVDGKIENLTEYLIKNNIRPSFQRIKILEYLANNNNHPTADEIYKDVVKDIPTLSKTTVYSTLTLFLESKIIRGLYIEENEIRYDAILYNHGHFKCKKCREIYDFAVEIDEFKSEGLEKFQIHEKGVYFKGICPKCIEIK
jgi:Fur family peroxide stress response transcriptional regulator